MVGIASMNRKARRRAMASTGHSWASARRLAKRQAADRKAEVEFAAKASRLSPEEARKALAEWAARGGGPATIEEARNGDAEVV